MGGDLPRCAAMLCTCNCSCHRSWPTICLYQATVLSTLESMSSTVLLGSTCTISSLQGKVPSPAGTC